jgi:hypothetical protein
LAGDRSRHCEIEDIAIMSWPVHSGSFALKYAGVLMSFSLSKGRKPIELKQVLADFRTESERTAPIGRIVLYTAKVEEFQASFLVDQALGVGDGLAVA